MGNRGAAGGTIAGQMVARAKPDGHTLFFVTGTFITAAAGDQKLPYNVCKDLTPILTLYGGERSRFDGDAAVGRRNKIKRAGFVWASTLELRDHGRVISDSQQSESTLRALAFAKGKSVRAGGTRTFLAENAGRVMIAIALIAALEGALYFAPNLSAAGHVSLLIFVSVIAAWVVLGLPETPVALAGALGLIVLGAVPGESLNRALGNDIIWLLIAAFVFAAVLSKTCLTQRVVLYVATKARSGPSSSMR